MHQVIHTKCSFSRPIRACNDMALWHFVRLVNNKGSYYLGFDVFLRIYSVRFCGGVRFSLPSLMWMPIPLSSIMWMSGR